MKRTAALTPLSHDHHQALYVAKVIKDSDEVEPAIEAFAGYWEKYGALHFRVEEEVLLPGSGLAGPSSDEEVARVLDEHLEIRKRARKAIAGDASLKELKDLGALLSEHVRFEERQFFPRIESQLSAEQLETLAVEIQAAEEQAG